MSVSIQAGVMGWPIEHSLSPKLHGYWLRQYKIEGSYVPLAVKPEELAEAIKALSDKGFRGVNLTVPHKEAGLKIVDQMDENAKRVGAVNTVIVVDGKLEGRNTDVYGFAQNLISHGVDVMNKPVALLGAGGAARAAIVALQDMGVHDIRLMNRTQAKAKTLALEFSNMEQEHFLPPDEDVEEAVRKIHKVTAFEWGDIRALEGAALLVNATTLGLKGQPSLEVDVSALPPNATVTDMVYAPLETELLKRAKQRGLKTVDGLGMLLHQARPAFKAFFGKDPEVTDALRAHVLGCVR